MRARQSLEPSAPALARLPRSLSGIATSSTRLGLLVLALTASLSLSACGGCDAKQKNFRTTPATPCIQFVADVCDAQSNWITLKNNCAEPLQIGSSSAASGAGGSGTAADTIAPGSSKVFMHPYLESYADGVSHLRVSARIGETPVVITFDVVG